MNIPRVPEGSTQEKEGAQRLWGSSADVMCKQRPGVRQLAGHPPSFSTGERRIPSLAGSRTQVMPISVALPTKAPAAGAYVDYTVWQRVICCG